MGANPRRRSNAACSDKEVVEAAAVSSAAKLAAVAALAAAAGRPDRTAAVDGSASISAAAAAIAFAVAAMVDASAAASSDAADSDRAVATRASATGYRFSAVAAHTDADTEGSRHAKRTTALRSVHTEGPNLTTRAHIKTSFVSTISSADNLPLGS